MADFVQVPPDSTGKKIDAVSLDVGANTVMRQRIVIADNSATSEFAQVANGRLVVTVAGNLNISAMPTVSVTGGVGISGTAVVSGNVNISSMPTITLPSNIGTLNDISRTVQVAIGTPFTVNAISATVSVSGLVGLTAGTANIGRINDISATVTVSGNVNISATHSVILAAGTALIGDVNAISRTVQVAVGTPFTINNISASVVVTGLVGLTAGAANIGFINHISQTVQVAIGTPFTVNNISAAVALVAGTTVNISNTASVVLAAGTANFGTLNNISRTVEVTVSTPFTLNNISATVTTQVAGFTPAVMSASHGPKCVTASSSAVVTLVASPGAGQSVHITQIMVGNGSNVFTKARIGTSASAATVVQPLAAAGGGFVFQFDPPWKLSASEAAICSVKPNASDVFFNVNFFVAS